jgi:alpha 1,6-mannosyltransferase
MLSIVASRMASIGPRITRVAIMIAALLMMAHLIYAYRSRIDSWRAYRLQRLELVQDREQKLNHFSAPFPRKIWQTGKSGFINLSEDTQKSVRTWLKLNQNWRYEVLTDYSAETFVRKNFKDRPDILEVYFDIADPILRADMLRYLVLLGHGGVYSDMDTVALKPIDNWIPFDYKDRTSMVVGIEYDRMDGQRWADWTLDLQFTNWAIMAKPNHPALDLTVRNLIRNIRKLVLEKDTDMGHLKLSQHEILNCTGPALFTMAVFEHLSASLGSDISWLNVTRLQEPTLFDDILILPVTSFGNSQPHSASGNADEDHAYVTHLFAGTWKADRPIKSDDQNLADNKDRIDDAQRRLALGEITSDDLIQVGKDMFLGTIAGIDGRMALARAADSHQVGQMSDEDFDKAREEWSKTVASEGRKVTRYTEKTGTQRTSRTPRMSRRVQRTQRTTFPESPKSRTRSKKKLLRRTRSGSKARRLERCSTRRT